MNNLVLILGDQLDAASAALEQFDPAQDVIWMAETPHEATHVWCHQLRIALFFSAMRHFRDELRERAWTVHYHVLTAEPAEDQGQTFGEILTASIEQLRPRRLIVVQPGDWRVQQELQQTAQQFGLPLEIREDRHFYCQPEEFAAWAEGKKELRLEFFYRSLRKQHRILLQPDGSPTGGEWNYDSDNRESFGKQGPPARLAPRSFPPDAVTVEVLELVAQRFGQHPGSLEHFDLPVTAAQAQQKLAAFVEYGLPNFGRFEDAMWTGQTYLYHSLLSACLNLKLLSPRECVAAAVAAYENGSAPLNSVEGFVRQILGWREYIRGIYWLKMPDYAELNFFDHQRDVPAFYWDGQTEMACVRDSMANVLNHGYAHHIQRLMVLGNLAQLLGVHPYKFHEWHMAMYLDAIDWVSLPNTLGMSQYGDGGIVGTKPYCASGNYINKMSNYCRGCRYDYKQRTGPRACPFTTLYWDFLNREFDLLAPNRRMTFPIKNVARLRENPDQLQQITSRATELLEQWYPEGD